VAKNAAGKFVAAGHRNQHARRTRSPDAENRFIIRVDSWLTSCARHRTRGHCALSAMLTVSQLSKSFASRALFDDVSLQVNRGDRIKFQS
jgi:hypothetical protein